MYSIRPWRNIGTLGEHIPNVSLRQRVCFMWFFAFLAITFGSPDKSMVELSPFPISRQFIFTAATALVEAPFLLIWLGTAISLKQCATGRGSSAWVWTGAFIGALAGAGAASLVDIKMSTQVQLVSIAGHLGLYLALSAAEVLLKRRNAWRHAQQRTGSDMDFDNESQHVQPQPQGSHDNNKNSNVKLQTPSLTASENAWTDDDRIGVAIHVLIWGQAVLLWEPWSIAAFIYDGHLVEHNGTALCTVAKVMIGMRILTLIMFEGGLGAVGIYYLRKSTSRAWECSCGLLTVGGTLLVLRSPFFAPDASTLPLWVADGSLLSLAFAIGLLKGFESNETPLAKKFSRPRRIDLQEKQPPGKMQQDLGLAQEWVLHQETGGVQEPEQVESANTKIAKNSANFAANHISTSTTAIIHDDEDFHRFTRGRFVQNEAEEMASRYTHFNVDELAKVAASAASSEGCIHIEKFADSMHNKALLLTIDNSKQLVAKIPNLKAGQSHFTTASEVATMDVMRNVLGTPVPQVYTWCSHAERTPVGAEYIIMEKAAGAPLKSVWHTLGLSDRFTVVKRIASLQATWTAAQYEGYGSIYYASDVPEQCRLPLQRLDCSPAAGQRFVLGPTSGREWNDDGRLAMTFDRGPWKKLENYLEAIGKREIICVRDMPRLPWTQVTLCGPNTYQPTREKKLRALEYYLKIYEHVVPAKAALRKPSAWHGDLHIENIFVDPARPTQITCIIDWQSTEVTPLFAQARQPYIVDYNGPQNTGLDRPHLPSNFAELSPKEQRRAKQLLIDQSLCVGYRRWIQSQNADIWDCLTFQETPAFQLLLLARSLLVDGEAIYAAQVLAQLQTSDSILRNTDLSIPEQVAAEIEADSERALRGMEAMASIRDAIGDLFPEHGCVRADQYDEVKDALRQCKEQILDTFASTEDDRIAWEECWPFDD